ncbi:hypothetical protein [Methanosarcina horonobensis]|uniref:hypothetical protein n=1 Tax=Methanosarcina horonobensis TaxID=418008 RepID=UPI0022B8E658|nr:hypothetical protein [Methanosarcina horonobensis]
MLNYQKELKDCFDGVFEPIWRINNKKKKWDRMKEILISLYEIMELIEKRSTLFRSHTQNSGE